MPHAHRQTSGHGKVSSNQHGPQARTDAVCTAPQEACASGYSRRWSLTCGARGEQARVAQQLTRPTRQPNPKEYAMCVTSRGSNDRPDAGMITIWCCHQRRGISYGRPVTVAAGADPHSAARRRRGVWAWASRKQDCDAIHKQKHPCEWDQRTCENDTNSNLG